MSKRKAKPGVIGQFTINGKPVKITDSWEKTTFGQYVRILKMGQDKVELASIVLGLDYDLIKNAKITGLEKLLVASGFINTIPDIPKKATKIGGFKLPLNASGVFDPQFESLAQFEDMRMIMVKTDTKNPVELTESYAKYCAIYAQKLRDGEYDGDKAEAMIKEIYTYPAFDIISAGSFFLIRLWILLYGTVPSFQKNSQIQAKAIGTPTRKRSGSRQR